MKKIAQVLIIGVLLFGFSLQTQAEILFEDNFNTQDNWTITQRSDHAESCYPGGTGVADCSSWNLPDGWDSARNGLSMCTHNAPGNNNFYLNEIAGYPVEPNSSTCYGGTGKCLTSWEEACQLSQGAYDDSDKALGIDLGAEYQELYIRYKIKFSPSWQWGTNGTDGGSPQWKLGHVQRHVYGENPSSYFTNYDCRNSPVALPSIGSWLGSVPATVDDADPVYLKWNARCFGGTGDNCTSENYRCVGHDDWAQDGHQYYPRARHRLGDIGNNSLIDGQWHTIEFRLKTNTYSNSAWQTDGRYQVWLDGSVIIDRTSVEVFFGEASHNPPRGYSLVSIGGNNNNDFTKSEDTVDGEQWYVFDDMVVSTEYIGPDYVIGGAVTIRADVDQNSTINSADALLTLRNSLGLIMSSTNWQASSTTGDVNCDSNSNSTDALLILRESLGLDMSGTGWCVS